MGRPRLLASLQQGAAGRLTLVSAPAGSGKTTLLADWAATMAAAGTPAAWVSLDPGDDNPTTFWSYVIAAVGMACPGVGDDVRALLESPQPAPIDWVLTVLTNEIAAAASDLTLILDDYHVIETQPVHDSVAFLLDHLPPWMHVVIATRSDPPLPIAQLRGAGELTELRVAQMRFTSDEAAAFLTDTMGLGLTPTDMTMLETRTEGWIVGLQLAALSLRGKDDPASFVRAFAGDDR